MIGQSTIFRCYIFLVMFPYAVYLSYNTLVNKIHTDTSLILILILDIILIICFIALWKLLNIIKLNEKENT